MFFLAEVTQLFLLLQIAVRFFGSFRYGNNPRSPFLKCYRYYNIVVAIIRQKKYNERIRSYGV